METGNKLNTDYMSLLHGLTMLRSLVEDILTGNDDLKLDAVTYYSSFRLAADGFIEVSYAAQDDKHKELIRRELNKYIGEVQALVDSKREANIIKFPGGTPLA